MGRIYMIIEEYFKTPIWFEQKPEFIKSLNQAVPKEMAKDV